MANSSDQIHSTIQASVAPNVEIISILDKSGSMRELRADMIGGYNGFMADQRTLPGRARATLVQFSDVAVTEYQGVPVQHLGNLTLASYVTIGSTALLDAIGETLTRQGARIAEEGWAGKVIVNILTDGEENASTRFTLDQVKALVKEYQDKKGWTFLFQGADIDAFKVGDGFGISGATTHQFTKSAQGMAEAYATMSCAATALRTGTSA